MKRFYQMKKTVPNNEQSSFHDDLNDPVVKHNMETNLNSLILMNE